MWLLDSRLFKCQLPGGGNKLNLCVFKFSKNRNWFTIEGGLWFMSHRGVCIYVNEPVLGRYVGFLIQRLVFT